MGDKTVSVRVRFEGGDQVKAGLQEVGREGTRAIASIGTVSTATGAKLQNAGYQVSDFFVQVAGGTAPTRALAQQLPQRAKCSSCCVPERHSGPGFTAETSRKSGGVTHMLRLTQSDLHHRNAPVAVPDPLGSLQLEFRRVLSS